MTTMHTQLDRVVDLLDPAVNQLFNVDLEEARRRVLQRRSVGRSRRSTDRSRSSRSRAAPCGWRARWIGRCATSWRSAPKGRRSSSPIASTRCGARSSTTAWHGQFHPSYTRMVPAHYVVELALVGCPDPDPIYTRFFTPPRGTLPPDLDEIGQRYVAALSHEVIDMADRHRPRRPGSADRRQLLRRHRQRRRCSS